MPTTPRHAPLSRPARLRRPAVAAAGLALLAGVAVAAPASARPIGPSRPATWGTTVRTTAAPTGDAAMAAEVTRLVNVERAKVGCTALRVDSRLAAAARLHSIDMATKNYFSHTSLDGRSPWDRIQAQGYTAGSAENIAAGQPSAASVVSAWMNSAGHRANILSCSNKAVGVGIGHGGSYRIYWTQDFGRV